MGDNLGDFEQLVMLAVMRLDDEAYGTSIRDELKSRAERESSRPRSARKSGGDWPGGGMISGNTRLSFRVIWRPRRNPMPKAELHAGLITRRPERNMLRKRFLVV